MDNLRNIIIEFANLIIVGIVAITTLVGFIAVGRILGTFGGGSFSVVGALGGGVLGFIIGCVATCLLAILVDIRAILLRTETKPATDGLRLAAR
ncbi:MAG: hypothetical protein ACREQR_10075 [Candidatus Binataceae bacterium]